MVHYASLPASKLLRKDSSSRMSSASTASSSTADSMWAVSGLSGGGFQTDYSVHDGVDADVRAAGRVPTVVDASATSDASYFQFSDDQQAELLHEARANAAALVVDVLSDFDKWQFVAAKGPLNVFELRADAAERVSSMVPPGSAPIAKHMHTMLGMTRVRAKLDDFMRIFASSKREAFQDVQTCLNEDRVQLADVFSSFGSPVGRRASNASMPASQQDDGDLEQYSVKYVSLKPVPSKKLSSSTSSSSAALSSSSSSLKFGRGVRRRLRAAQQAEEEDPNTGVTLCLGEYATIRHGKVRAAPSANSLAASGGRSQSSNSSALEDHRIGIISQHSLEDPAVTRYCKPVTISTGQSSSGSSSPSTVLFAQRSLAQFSGIVVYPVASSTAGESLLEVLIKFSVYNPSPQGVSHAMRLNMLAYVSAFQNLENALLVMRLRESPFLTSRNWVRSRSRKCCYLCQAGFSSFRRKHHCRLCGEVTCSKCSDVHQIKLGRAGKCPFRICVQCVHGTDDSLRLQRRRGSSNESTADNTLSRSQTHIQPQGDDDDDDDDADENDPSRRDQYAPPLKSSVVRNLAASAASARGSNASTTSASSGSDFYDSRGLLATSAGPKAQTQSQSQSQTQSPRPPMNLTTLSVASSSATTARSTTGSDLSPVRYQNESSSPSSPASPGSAVLSEEDSDSFYARFSEMSLRDFHDSEFDLSLKGMPGMAERPTGFEFDDSERGSDHELDDIGEEDDDGYDGREIDIDAMPLPSPHMQQSSKQQADITDDESEFDFERESGMEFHDSEIGIEFDASEIDIDGHLAHLIDEEIEEEDDIDDDDEDIDEIIDTSGSGERAVAPGHGSLAVIDQIRAARLAEYGILDSGKENIYDVVAKQAAQHLDCALATVSFVDARREYVKAAFGASSSNSDIPKAHSLTAHIMRRCLLEDRDVVVVGDARNDDLLSANMFVYEAPFIRFAVGVPVRAVSDGTILGALVVADPRPRGDKLSPSQERMLRDLAEQVSALLEDRLARNLSAPGTGTAGPGQMREKLADLLSQSYHTGLQVQKNEHKILNSSGSSLSGSGSSSASLSASMLGGSSGGALSASMLGGPTSSRRFDPSGSAYNASSSAYNLSGSAFNPNGSRFDPSYSRIQPKFHTTQSRPQSHMDDYGGMNGIEL